MKVILREDVAGIGKAGDLVEVAPGFGRNFLIPKKLAIEATEKNRKVAEQERQLRLERLAKAKGEALALAQTLLSISCTIPRKAGENEKLFGAVTSADIAEYLQREGVEIDRRKIELETPIKTLGVHEVPVKLHPEVVANVKVSVVKE
ncbi:MAG: 50S ribosomal protein L9 [Candidatus Tectomicrobia bacterium]|nr:50S ribosomal protein L9 [Candidatus Tectomicrobia bacterium]